MYLVLSLLPLLSYLLSEKRLWFVVSASPWVLTVHNKQIHAGFSIYYLETSWFLRLARNWREIVTVESQN